MANVYNGEMFTMANVYKNYKKANVCKNFQPLITPLKRQILTNTFEFTNLCSLCFSMVLLMFLYVRYIDRPKKKLSILFLRPLRWGRNLPVDDEGGEEE